MSRIVSRLLSLVLVILVAGALSGCDSSRRRGGGGGGGGGGNGDGDDGAGGGEGRPDAGRLPDVPDLPARDGSLDFLDTGEATCPQGARRCVGEVVYLCTSEKTWGPVEDCGARGRHCEGGECVGCNPGERTCQGQTVVECQADGRSHDVVEVCDASHRCQDARCVPLCEARGGKVSNSGCEYFAVDLENAVEFSTPVSPQDAQFALGISNVDERAPVDIQVFVQDREGPERVVASARIGPLQVGILELPSRNLTGSAVSSSAFRVQATLPVVAYQFNPLNNTEEAFSNDASLLLPTAALGQEYLVTTGDGLPGWGATITVVGVSPGETRVTVETTADVEVPGGEGIVEASPRRVVATLRRYETLNLRATGGQPRVAGSGNLSGSRVTASAPVAVFSGNVATNVPNNEQTSCCGDHLEEQMCPTHAWGRRFAAARSLVRRVDDPEWDWWRVTALRDGTTLTFRPTPPRGVPRTLDAGRSVEFYTYEGFTLEASEPVSLVHFLSSSGQATRECDLDTRQVLRDYDACCTFGECEVREEEVPHRQCVQRTGFRESQCYPDPDNLPDFCLGSPIIPGHCTQIGDPAMVIIPPVEQFRQDYVFLTPLDYELDFVNIVATTGAAITLDGSPVREWRPLGELDGQPWSYAQVTLGDGTHVIRGDRAFGIAVYGYDRDVSYGYVGGLNLERIDR